MASKTRDRKGEEKKKKGGLVKPRSMVKKGSSKVEKKPAEKVLAVATGGIKRPHHFHPGTIAMRKSKKYQNSADSVIPQRPLSQLIRVVADEILSNNNRGNPKEEAALHFDSDGLKFMRNVVENHMIKELDLAKELCIFRGRRTVDVKDIQMSLKIFKKFKAMQ